MNNEQQTNEAFDNFHNLAAKAIKEIDAFIAMDINATPQEAIFMGYKAELVEAKASVRETQERANKAKRDAEHFRDMMPTSNEANSPYERKRLEALPASKLGCPRSP